jgi:putative SOS response-associated peptidase YedK
MCGRFNLIDSPQVQLLCALLGVPMPTDNFRADIAPGGPIGIVLERRNAEGGKTRQVSEAIWWLLLDSTSLTPNYKYASFNSRSDKLDTPRSAAYTPFRESRCIIPASAFVEGLGDKKTYHKIELEDAAIAFGGVYKQYVNRETGESVLGASIITLPPLIPQWQHIHPKSLPLMLDMNNKELIDKWLDPGFDRVEEFAHALEPRVTVPMKVTPIDRPSRWNPIADSFLIVA